ncbi:hypothetical protein CEXT_613791 [Caerostris extrusa]|uniref:Uncharacterized protein n=1 Tax=Caerostris extrusa TaxID=172846 RepID=A0AAV4NG83_CAEEX|nr:hypothetical protein CEXT_613791 [Caerostris extrusa]
MSDETIPDSDGIPDSNGSIPEFITREELTPKSPTFITGRWAVHEVGRSSEEKYERALLLIKLSVQSSEPTSRDETDPTSNDVALAEAQNLNKMTNSAVIKEWKLHSLNGVLLLAASERMIATRKRIGL